MTEALALLEQRLDEAVRVHLAPPPRRSVSRWAEDERIVSSYSAEPGHWRNERTPYLVEPMDCFSDPTVEMVVFQKCARIGGTELGLNITGYFVDQDPSHILIVQPTVEDAKDFSKDQLAAMLADTPCLAGKVRDPRSRDSGNTVQNKQFPGGSLKLIGANSARGFRRITVRVVIFEEVDGYPASAGTEGDQVKLGMKRTETVGYRRKIYMNSTPTLKDASRIEDYYRQSDQRRYHVPCPVCHVLQPLWWKHLKWEKDAEGQPIPASVHYACPDCGGTWTEEQKFPAMQAGQWIPARPEREMRGYHINALYSPWVSWLKLIREWTEAQGDMGKLQVFVNTALGETWEERSGGLAPEALRDRADAYAGAEVPEAVQVLTMGVDVQDDRLEATIWGWGAGRARYRIHHAILAGDPGAKAVWSDLDTLKARSWTTPSGRTLKVYAAAVDSGAHTDAVYAWAGPKYASRVYCCKGASTPGKPLLPRGPTRNNKARIPLFLIGTEAAKDEWYSALRTPEPGPNYVAFDPATDDEYRKQLTNERPVREFVNGRWLRRYKLNRGDRAEALDCAVLALVALLQSRVRLDRGAAPVMPVTRLDPANPAPPPPMAPVKPNIGQALALQRLRRGLRR